MSGHVPARWREEGSTQAFEASRRRGRVLVLLALVVGVVALGILCLDYLRPPVRCRGVALVVCEYKALPPRAWRAQDHAAFTGGGFFSAVEDGSTSPTQARLVRELTNLAQPSRDSVVVYLSAYARADAGGGVQILPGDCDPNDPVTWLPLARVLELFQQAATRNKLLVLDLEAPPLTARQSLILDDVASSVLHDLDAVPDRDRLVLCSCSPGQRPWASEFLGRSVFGYYFEEGLRGRGDGSNDGQVRVRELAAFASARVDRWAQRARGVRQTPWLHGDGDFAVLELPNGTPRPATELPAERTYPEYLAKAWQEASGPRQRAELLTAERDWRVGVPEERVKSAVKKAAALAAAAPAPPPPARTLALALGDRDPSPDLADALRQVAFQAAARTRGLDATKADAVRGQLLDDFLKANKDTSPLLLAHAALDVAIVDPRPDVLRLAVALVKRLEPIPLYAETVELERLATLNLDELTLQRALSVLRDSEQAASRPRLFDWLGRDLEAAVQARHEAFVLLDARGYASPADGSAVLADAATRTASVLRQQTVLRQAKQAEDAAQALLPQLLLYDDEAGLPDKGWLTAVGQARALRDRMLDARQNGVPRYVDDLSEQAAQVRRHVAELGEVFTHAGAHRLRHAARAGAAAGPQWRQLHALLATTQFPAAERESVWATAAQLSRRLEDDVLRLDRRDGTGVGELFPSDDPDRDRRLAEQAQRAIALATLAGLPAQEKAKLDALHTRAGYAQVERALLLAWQSLPPPLPPSRLWAWMADRYRYLARDYGVLYGPAAPVASFYQRAAAEYRGWLTSSREEYVDIIESGDPPRLLPDQPIRPTLEVLPFTAKPARLAFRLFVPDRGWLDVSPTTADLPAAGVKTTPEGGYVVPVRIALRPTAGATQAATPAGLLARVTVNGDRGYHRLVPVPLSPRAPEVLLSASDKAAEPGMAEVRLRTAPGKQAVYVYLKNPIDKVWNKLQVRLTTTQATRETAPITLGPREVKRIAFPPAVAVPPPTPGVAGMPELTGPLRIEVLDQEGNTVVTRRDVPVSLADPVEYVAITNVGYDPSGGRDRLSIQLRLRRPLTGPAVNAVMGFPPIVDGGATFATGTLKGTVPADLSEVTLFADGVAGRNGRAQFYLTIDGWARAFLFETSLLETGPVTPRQLFLPTVRELVSPVALASADFKVPVETDNAPPGTRLEVALGRKVGGVFSAEVMERRPQARNQRIGFDPSGPGGALLFEASLSDWVVPMDTTKIRGARELRARLLDREDRVIAVTSKELTLGDSAPEVVRFVDPPKQAWRQKPLVLLARGTDPLVGVKEANFFLGKPVADKLPPGAATVPGVALDSAKTLWQAAVPLPADKKGPTDVSVQLVNGLGLSAFATVSVEVEETDPAKAVLGTIKGVVNEGDRPQSGLEVLLTDDKKAEKGRQRTKADGTFAFADLPAGKYRLGVTKPANGRVGTYPRAATEYIDLTPGGTVTADVPLFLP